jgi:hypothetical protein
MLAMAISPFLVGSKIIMLRWPNCISSSTRMSHLLKTDVLRRMSKALSLVLADSLSGFFEIREMPKPVGSRDAIASRPMMAGEAKSEQLPKPQSDSSGDAVPVEEHEDGADRGVLSAKDLVLETDEDVEKAVLSRRRLLVRMGENDWRRADLIVMCGWMMQRFEVV